MIGYLRGAIATLKAQDSSRKTSPCYILTLDVRDVGYDLVITASAAKQMPPEGNAVKLFTHMQVREDQTVLYGFISVAERDLFRQLIGVTGVGAQMAMALLNTLGLQDLVKAIVTGNSRILSLTPGVGNKTAERLALELKTKLADWRQQVGVTIPVASVVQEDVEMTLLALGYTPTEIGEALRHLAASPALSQSQDIEAWLKAAITWLSKS
ncbi:Holliday junction branch migration protein RuvA [Pseudanabaena sp. PCC 6802]|uniref:Holliday junction branch migration protein RuvA n=1 Tax=Pseudanabaena sp. PCC 6802 TaxID=118173 RepID=UPI0003449AD3|nr:Holliday junction branch migration protein RuvA [Pseudanabaena sp. PCC 6802]